MKEQKVILVNEDDEPIGLMPKMEAHEKGLLHRAFSVFIFDSQGKMLLQQRSAAKYHGANLWTNACCSHPFPDEKIEDAAQRRLKEEFGFTTSLEKIFSFRYHAAVENNLIEHELDHVFAGIYEGNLQPNFTEIAAYSYSAMNEIKQMIQARPEKFTSWFKIAFPKIGNWWEENFGTLQ